LVVNLATRFERDTLPKNFSTSATSRLRRLPAASTMPVHHPDDRFVDKLLNIHRIECAELPSWSTADFLSSFDPVQTQGLFNR
jgi:hypothetical protein